MGLLHKGQTRLGAQENVDSCLNRIKNGSHRNSVIFWKLSLNDEETPQTLICIPSSEEEKILKALDILQLISFVGTHGRKNNFLT